MRTVSRITLASVCITEFFIKRLYWQATPPFAGKIRSLIYPAPDIRMPFLGLHVTRSRGRKSAVWPNGDIRAFGRENYSLWVGLMS